MDQLLAKIKVFLAVMVTAGLIFRPVFACGEDLNLSAKAAALVDGDTGRLLYGENEEEFLPMASTTKIMTCILALEYGNPDDTVTVSSYAASMPDVQLNIREGETYRLEDLLYSLMLESHNDTAVAIAEHISGSVEAFAEKMNQKAKEIGAVNTHFVTPNGLDAEGHGSTAYDMALIGSYAIKNEEFVHIINTASYSFSSLDGKRSFLVNNHDAFLQMMDGALGIKTGFTGKAGYCFVGALKQGEKTFVSCVLACGWPPNKTYKWADTRKLMNFGLEYYDYQVLWDSAETGQEPADISVENGVKDWVKTEFTGYLKELVSEKDEVKVEYRMEDSIQAPVKKGQEVGFTVILINGNEEGVFPVLAAESVEKRTFSYVWGQIVKYFWGFYSSKSCSF